MRPKKCYPSRVTLHTCYPLNSRSEHVFTLPKSGNTRVTPKMAHIYRSGNAGNTPIKVQVRGHITHRVTVGNTFAHVGNSDPPYKGGHVTCQKRKVRASR